MFYYTNFNSSELAGLEDRKVERSDQTYSDFKLEFPVQLEFITMHPDDNSEYFSMGSIGPDRSYYALASRDEIGDRLIKNGLHHHSFYELLFVMKGEVYQVIENKRHLYTPGSCCLLNKNVLHTEEHETDFEIAFLEISDEVLADVYKDITEGFFEVEKSLPDRELFTFLKETLSASSTYDKEYIDFIPHEQADAAQKKVYEVLELIAKEMIDPRIGSTHMIKSLIAKLLYVLSDPGLYDTKPIQIGTDSENALYNQIDKIMNETMGRATRSFLESELHYSGDYLNKITKKYTGLSIHDFGMTICMKKAARELLSTNKSISDIALSLGFSNRTHFYKQFEKVYHTLPGEFRKNFSQNAPGPK